MLIDPKHPKGTSFRLPATDCQWQVLIARSVLTALLEVVDFVCSGNALIYCVARRITGGTETKRAPSPAAKESSRFMTVHEVPKAGREQSLFCKSLVSEINQTLQRDLTRECSPSPSARAARFP